LKHNTAINFLYVVSLCCSLCPFAFISSSEQPYHWANLNIDNQTVSAFVFLKMKKKYCFQLIWLSDEILDDV